MAGSPENPLSDKGIPEKIREVMVRFAVDEKLACELLGFSALIASETVEKWKKNLRRLQLRKAEEILELIEKAKKGDIGALVEAESRLGDIIKLKSWER